MPVTELDTRATGSRGSRQAGALVTKLDTDRNRATAERFGIRSIPPPWSAVVAGGQDDHALA